MGLLDKLKSLFGSDQSGQSSARRNDADPTVEYEPTAESEHAVKGTDAGSQQRSDQQEQGHAQSGKGLAGGQSTEHRTAGGATPEQTDETEPEESTSTPEKADDPSTEDTVEETADTDEETADTDEETADTDEETADTDDAITEAESEETPVDSPSVEEIKGIGPTYAERLEAAGIGTVADLAAADPADVAEAAETGENRAGDWVERAQDF